MEKVIIFTEKLLNFTDFIPIFTECTKNQEFSRICLLFKSLVWYILMTNEYPWSKNIIPEKNSLSWHESNSKIKFYSIKINFKDQSNTPIIILKIYHMMFVHVRSWCPDRTIPQARRYISDSMGQRYADAVILNLEETHAEGDNRVPLICLLSMGSDPTNQIESLCKKLHLGMLYLTC